MYSAAEDDDLTGRARIREAALDEFADRGHRGATIRSIAARAGVSPALVQHHFGTKDRLRAACDDYIVSFIRGEAAAAVERPSGLAEPDYYVTLHRTGARMQRYLARALIDGSAAAADLFDELVRLVADLFVERPDAPSGHADRAVVLVAMRLGVLVLHEHVSRGMGADIFDEKVGMRVGQAMLELLNPGLLPAEVMAITREGMRAYQERGESDR